MLNPIDKIKTAENPGLLAYAHSAGGAVIRPEDMGKAKGKAVTAMRQQTADQVSKIQRQMEVLARQVLEIRQRVEISERIYEATVGFEPIIGHEYFLYEKTDGFDVLSMVGPEEWGRKFPFSQFLAKVFLLADHTWEVKFFNEDNRDDSINV